jgi:hypothetical protein
MKALLAMLAGIGVMVGLAGCGDRSISGKKLSEVAASCDQASFVMKVSFYDNIIPKDGDITKDRICKAVKEYSESMLKMQIDAVESEYGEQNELCKAIKKLATYLGSYKAVEEDFIRRVNSDPSEENKLNLASLRLCGMSATERIEYAKKIATNIGIKIYSVGTIRNPPGKSCFAYLSESTYKNNRTYHLHAPDCGLGGAAIEIKTNDGKPATERMGNIIRERYNYTGELPASGMLNGETFVYYSPSLTSRVSEGVGQTAGETKSLDAITSQNVGGAFEGIIRGVFKVHPDDLIAKLQSLDLIPKKPTSGADSMAGYALKHDVMVLGFPINIIEAAETSARGPGTSPWYDFTFALKEGVGNKAIVEKALSQYGIVTSGEKMTVSVDEWDKTHVTISAQRAGTVLLSSEKEEINSEYAGDWAPERSDCKTSARMIVTSENIILRNGSDRADFNNYYISHTYSGGAKYDGIEVAVSATSVGDSARDELVIIFNDDKTNERGVARVNTMPDSLSKRFPLLDTKLVKCGQQTASRQADTSTQQGTIKQAEPVIHSSKEKAYNAMLSLGATIAGMEASSNPRCRGYANALYKRLGSIEKYYNNGEIIEGRIGDDRGIYSRVIQMSQESEAMIGQMGCQ